MNDLLEYDFVKKKVTKEDIEKFENDIDIKNMKFTYFQKLHKSSLKCTNKKRYENERFYCLSLNKSISDLQLPFLNVCYYKRKYEEIGLCPCLKWFRLKEFSYYEELYFYYFFVTINEIFKIFDKTGILLNECLDLNVNKEDKKNFSKQVTCEINNIPNKFSEINKYLEYMQDYKKTVFFEMKEKYRNKNTHDFTSEIPKHRIKNNKVFYEESLKVNETYEDLLKLLNELKKYIKLVDDIVLYTIRNNYNNIKEKVKM